MKCLKCGEELPKDAKFCTSCGANIEETKLELEKKQEEQEQENKVSEENINHDAQKEQKEAETTENIEKQEVDIENESNKNVEPDDLFIENNKENELVEDDVEKFEDNEEENISSNQTKKGHKKVIIAIIIIIVLLAGCGVGAFILLKSDEDEEKSEEELEWGDIYLQVLNEDDKLEDLDDMQISLIDLDMDDVPELIVQGLNEAGDIIAQIFKINDENKVDTLNVTMNEDSSIEMVYNLSTDDYEWYVIDYENENSPVVYNLNISSGTYEQEKLDINYSTDVVLVSTDTNKSKTVSFCKDLTEKEREEKFEEAKEGYTTKEDMITSEIEEKIELAKIIYNIEKIDSSKELVYTVSERHDSYGDFEYPCININNDNIKKINSEIEDEYGFTNTSNESTFIEQIGAETEEISYSWTLNGKILSLLIWEGGNESIWATTYNINLETLEEISAEDLLAEYNLNKETVIDNATDALEEEFETVMKKEKSNLGSYWDDWNMDEYVDTWEDDIEDSVEKLVLYVNDSNELCLIGEYEHLGGQWSCWQSVIVNLNNTYNVSELEFKYSTMTHYYQENKIKSSTSSSNSSTNSSSSSGSSSSSSNSSSKSSNITQEEALKLAQQTWGTSSEDSGSEIGYTYVGWGKDNSGKKYYIFDVRWAVYMEDGTTISHWSYIGTICIAFDGKTYKQLSSAVSSADGETYDMLDGGDL